tara:strand:+ start:698 stop:1468 length:771 start_codon:yes stop_codon:yes gene_type:complete
MTQDINNSLSEKAGRKSLLIGLLDSGVSPQLMTRVVDARAFVKGEGGAVVVEQAQPDLLGHGSTLARIITARVPEARFLVAQIFVYQLSASANQAAAGLDWLVAQGAQIVNMSFGLRADRQPLAQACERALAAGVLLVAAAPAVGAAVYPSGYPGVIRVTGDVRCGADQFSELVSSQADYGACVRVTGSPVAGASVATAYLSAQLGRYYSRESADDQGLRTWLAERASYRGIAQHFALIPPERRLTWSAVGSASLL